MSRENFLNNEGWSGVDDESQVRTRMFARPGGNARRVSARASAGRAGLPVAHALRRRGDLFVLNGRPTLYNGESEEQLAAGDIVFCPEGRDGLHTFRNTTNEPVRILAISAGRFPDVVAYPEHGYAWVATRDPEFPEPETGDKGVIARVELPPQT
jgi:mannose-6-phosphate isomerase-like protein (cupin superfamily)